MTTCVLTYHPPSHAPVKSYAFQDLEARYESYLYDESKLKGQRPASISFPRSSAEVSALFRQFFEQKQQIVLCGARTGLCGGASPVAGCQLVSLERMKKIGELKENAGQFEISMEAGVTLLELQSHLEKIAPDLFFPVDPTESSASIGGSVGTNASGARSLFYGPVRNWVSGLTGVLSSGHSFSLRRGELFIGEDLSIRDGNVLRVLPAGEILAPLGSKSALGYSYGPGKDLIDLFIGSEGTLAAFTEITLKLASLPKERLYYLQFLDSNQVALDFAARLAKIPGSLLALEYFDEHSLCLLKKNASRVRSRAVGMISDNHRAAVFCDFALQNAMELESIINQIETLLADLLICPGASIAATEDRDLRDIKAFRHAVPEQINSIVAERKKTIPALHKIATDMSVPEARFKDMLDFYLEKLKKSGLEYYIFGHLGEYHLHVNMVPRDEEELLRAKNLYLVFAQKTVALGGAVAAEHGIGRIKKQLLSLQYPESTIEFMRCLKKFFDPPCLLNRGVIFDP